MIAKIAAVGQNRPLTSGSESEPVEVGGRQYLLGVSVGIAHFPEHAASMEGLMQKADIAMYEAKQAGVSNYRLAGGNISAAVSAVSHPLNNRPDCKPTH
jgi:diguanylate cyclase (GGDEF)-like protein